MKKERYIILWIISIVTINLCFALLTIGTYSIFEDKVIIHHHLEAGTLKINLSRTKLVYNKLNNSGVLEEYENNEIVDFTKTSTKDRNIFDINNDTLIIPGSKYHAYLTLTNSGSVAFNYYIKVITKSKNSLSNQIKITIIVKDNDYQYQNTLSEGLLVGNAINPLGSINASENVNFEIILEFIDSKTNNDAKNENTNFDVIVYAIQKE